jgi:hypothetical protein
MNKQTEVRNIEVTLKKIFKKKQINNFDVLIANKLLLKWKKLTNYKEDDGIILDKEPNYR